MAPRRAASASGIGTDREVMLIRARPRRKAVVIALAGSRHGPGAAQSRVTSAVTLGLPSRSPPIQEWNRTQGAIGSLRAKAGRTAALNRSNNCGTASKRHRERTAGPIRFHRARLGRSSRNSPVIHKRSISLSMSSKDLVAFARGPALGFQRNQLAVDAAVDFQHGDALGLGRMGGQRRADPTVAPPSRRRPRRSGQGQGRQSPWRSCPRRTRHPAALPPAADRAWRCFRR